MINMFLAEISKLARRRILGATAVIVLLASFLATTVVFLSAANAPEAAPERGTTLAALSGAGGGTEAFSIALSFIGVFVFVVFIANWTGEFSQGTLRTLLMRQPGRFSALAGKLGALLVFAAGVLLVAEAATWAMSLAFAPSQDVSTDAWFGLEAIGDAARNYRDALVGVAAWACFGMMLAVLLRSTPIALGVGIVWAGPFEHLTQNAWTAVSGWYPGLLLEALAVGGTDDASYGRALALLAAYVALAVTVATVSFARRDVTG